MSWGFDFSSRFETDLVGLDESVSEALDHLVVQWMAEGPPLQGERTMMGITFYEEVVAERYLLAYVADRDRSRFMLLWLRSRPGRW